MTKQITLDEALKLVSFKQNDAGNWAVDTVGGSVGGSVYGSVRGHVYGDVVGDVVGFVGGNVGGPVGGFVGGFVGGTIRGRRWEFIETPKVKLQRLIKEGANKEQLLEALNQLEDNG